jgi:NAD(P)H-quinone oxidoreductase subunit 4
VQTCDILPYCDIEEMQFQTLGAQEAVCFGTSCVLPADAAFIDAKPREIFIAVCFLMLIIGVGVYPKLATQIYDAKMVAVNAQVRQSYVQVAQNNPNLYAAGFSVPKLPAPELATVLVDHY